MIKNKGSVRRVVAVLLAAVMLIGAFVSCSARVKDPVLECEGQKISLSMYEFMLSRMKGTLARNKYDVSSLSSFWSDIHPGTDKTNEQYYNDAILENCKNYLAALVLFKEEGLELSSTALSDIEEEIGFYVDYDCNGSEEKFDALLSKYGTDADGLRAIYEIEAKYQQVLTSLYGANGAFISDNVKEEYYRENYYRFKQILVSNFHYEYMTDTQGNVIYFDPENSQPIYDTENGSYVYDDEGNRIKDEYGNTIYYDADGKILYNTEKGYPSPKTDDTGAAITYEYSKEEMEERVSQMNALISKVAKGDYAAFEVEMPLWELYEGAEEYYKDGYYLSDIEDSGYEDYMYDILEKLKEMDAGETAVVESEFGYHVIMKYELDKGKYADSDYAEWFNSFTDSLITKLFLDRCKSFYSEIEADAENIKKAKSIKTIGTNYDY